MIPATKTCLLLVGESLIHPCNPEVAFRISSPSLSFNVLDRPSVHIYIYIIYIYIYCLFFFLAYRINFIEICVGDYNNNFKYFSMILKLLAYSLCFFPSLALRGAPKNRSGPPGPQKTSTFSKYKKLL